LTNTADLGFHDLKKSRFSSTMWQIVVPGDASFGVSFGYLPTNLTAEASNLLKRGVKAVSG
jgi:hypothetical protein